MQSEKKKKNCSPIHSPPTHKNFRLGVNQNRTKLHGQTFQGSEVIDGQSLWKSIWNTAIRSGSKWNVKIRVCGSYWPWFLKVKETLHGMREVYEVESYCRSLRWKWFANILIGWSMLIFFHCGESIPTAINIDHWFLVIIKWKFSGSVSPWRM